MPNNPARVAIFCGSGCAKIRQPYYFDIAYQTGKALAQAGFVVITGAGPGLMDEALRGAHEAGGETIGVALNMDGRKRSQSAGTVFAYDTLGPRQAKIMELADAFVALPGGIGTLYELTEVLALKRVNELPHRKPLVLLGDYYQHLIKVFDDMITEGFADESLQELFHLAKEPADAATYIQKNL